MEKTSLKIVKILQKAGYQAYWAGGCVRDMLLGNEAKDFDIVTNAKPDDIEQLLKKTIPIGREFGVMLALEGDHQFEVATFRSEGTYTDKRRPDSVAFTHAEEDAKRRDFTVNGIFYDPIAKEIYDYVGGQEDLKERLLRFIGDPHQRIQEDHLRILRAIRFKNTLQFQYHPDTYHALVTHAKLADEVTGERIRDELNKMIVSEHFGDALEDMLETGVLQETLPEAYAMKGVPQPYEYHHEGDVWEHTKEVVAALSKYASLNVRWAAFLHDIGKPATFKLEERIRFDHHSEKGAEIGQAILRRLKFPRKDIEEIVWLVEHHMIISQLLEMPLGRKRHWFLHPWFKDLLSLMEADIGGTSPARYDLYTRLAEEYNETLKKIPHPPEPLLDGNEIMKLLKLPPGKHVGEIAKELREKQLGHEINTKIQARKWLKENFSARS